MTLSHGSTVIRQGKNVLKENVRRNVRSVDRKERYKRLKRNDFGRMRSVGIDGCLLTSNESEREFIHRLLRSRQGYADLALCLL